MSTARLLILGSVTALVLPLTARAQEKPVYSDADAAQHVGEDATVIGKVATVSKSAKGTTYLNFGGRFPQQLFNGVVFARDDEKVGDLKPYEGKSVALSGRIELGPDQKPQIIVRAAEQLKLTDGAVPMAAAPAPAPASSAATSSTPTTAASTTVSAASLPATAVPPAAATVASAASFTTTAQKRIALAPNWKSPARGGELTRKDLATLFGTRGSASESTDGNPAIEVYPGIPFLTPAATARKSLNLENASAPKVGISCPGLPATSFSAYVFGGVFPGGFNRLYLITDLADQVVSVLTVEENSRQRSSAGVDHMGYHTYNFISGRVKGTNDLVIRHDIAKDSPPGVVLVESLLIDPTDGEPSSKSSTSRSSSSSTRASGARATRTGKVLERSNWYVPAPIVNLILRSVGGH